MVIHLRIESLLLWDEVHFCSWFFNFWHVMLVVTVSNYFCCSAIQGVDLLFWDLGGQDELQSLWDKYYSECHGIVYVVDSLDENRVDDSRVAFEKMIQNQHLMGVPLLFLCNKQDMQDCLTVNQIREAFSDAAAKMGKRDCSVRGVSALHGQGLEDATAWLTDSIIKNSQVRPPLNKDE